MTIFDIGANIGLFNLYMNKKAKNLKIYSFEPIPSIYQCLKHNIPNNNNNIAINKGLGDKNEIIQMNYVQNIPALSSAYQFDDIKLKAHHKLYKEKCSIFKSICKNFIENQLIHSIPIKTQITTISDIIHKYNIDKIDIMKIDVEGFELNVIKGIKPSHFYKIKHIIIEIENFRLNNKNYILKILQKYNFKYNISENQKKQNWIIVNAYQQKIY